MDLDIDVQDFEGDSCEYYKYYPGDCGAYDDAFGHYREANAIRRTQLEFDPQALEAHVERIIGEWNSGEDLFSDEWINRMGDIVEDVPSSSLAKRDLLQQSQGAHKVAHAVLHTNLLRAQNLDKQEYAAGVATLIGNQLYQEANDGEMSVKQGAENPITAEHLRETAKAICKGLPEEDLNSHPAYRAADRIEFLNQQNTVLQEQNDALAAHVDRLRELVKEAWKDGFDAENSGDIDSCNAVTIANSEEEEHTQSLARRDAQIKANELKRFIRIYLTPGLAHNRATGELQSLQKQAEGHK